MDHYATLGISKEASTADIKKAYRALAMKYHPDKNPGDKQAEEMFKRVADAYAILGDPQKRKEWDDIKLNNSAQNRRGHGFDDFVNFDFGSREFNSQREYHNFRARRSQGKPHAPPPTTDHLNITLESSIDLVSALSGKKLELSFKRNKIEYTGRSGDLLNYITQEEEKEIQINLDLRKTFLLIKKQGDKYLTKVRVSKLGHEAVSTRTNIWNEVEQIPIFGDLFVNLEIIVPDNISIENNTIIQRVEIPLISVLTQGEKIRIETILGKKYEAEINSPKHLNNLKFTLKSEGTIDENKQLGDYLIKFDIIAPNLSKLNKAQRKQFLSILEET